MTATDAPHRPYPAGSAGTAGRGYLLVPEPRDTPAVECADPDEPGARVVRRERAGTEAGRG